MTTLKELVFKILREQPECRDSDKLLQWEVLNRTGFIRYSGFDAWITKEKFMLAPEFESIRRVRQQLQKTDLLVGAKLIQPTPKVKQKRVKLSKERGASYMMGKEPVLELYKFDEVSKTYKEV